MVIALKGSCCSLRCSVWTVAAGPVLDGAAVGCIAYAVLCPLTFISGS